MTKQTVVKTENSTKQLVITEKPSVARDIVAALGGSKRFQSHKGYYEGEDYLISWAIGHLLEFPTPEDIDPSYKRWKLNDLPIFPKEFTLKPKSGQKARLNLLKKLFKRKDVGSVVNACDAGREGELIFREIHQFIGRDLPVERLWLQSMTPSAIKNGFSKLLESHRVEGLGIAAECRAESDWLLGMNATRAVTKRLQTRKERVPWSVGRVQTPTLALIVDRELSILAHQSKPYWRIQAVFSTPPGAEMVYEGTWFDPGFKKQDEQTDERENRIMDEERAKEINEKIQGKTGTASEKRKPYNEKAPSLFDLTNLQREANRRFGYSARRTLQAAQRLYEEYKLITYPRTDSRCLPTDYRAKVNEIINKFASGSQYASSAGNLLDNGLLNQHTIFNDAGISDHFAIIPTEMQPKKLPNQDAKIYDLIVRRFLAAFYPKAVWENVERITVVEGEHFKTRTRTLKQAGWRAVFQRSEQEKDKLPPIEQDGAQVQTEETKLLEEETDPPQRISEAGLLNMMENAGKQIEDKDFSRAMREKGLGTPATRAEIIESLISRGYIKRVAKALAATTKGIRLIDLIRRIKIERLSSPELTGELEFHLFEVEKGKRSRERFSQEIRNYTQEIVERAKSFSFDSLYSDDPPLAPCPKCKKRNVVEESLVYRCEGTASSECSFLLWKEKQGRYLDRITMTTLLQHGKTPPVSGFFTHTGKPYKAVLSLLGSSQIQVTPLHTAKQQENELPVDERPICSCPVCSDGKVIQTSVSYICSNGESKGCYFGLPRILLGRQISREEVKQYVEEGKTEVLEGFISRRGRPFKAALVLGDNGRHKWEFASRTQAGRQTEGNAMDPGKIEDETSLGTCPVCEKGNIITAEQAYICKNDTDNCPFVLPRVLANREISRDEAAEYVANKKTKMLDGFVSRRGRPFKASLVLTKKGRHRWKFPPKNQR